MSCCICEERSETTANILQATAGIRRSPGKVPFLDLPDTDEVLTDILQSPSPSSRVRRQFLDPVKKECDSGSMRNSSEVVVLYLEY